MIERFGSADSQIVIVMSECAKGKCCYVGWTKAGRASEDPGKATIVSCKSMLRATVASLRYRGNRIHVVVVAEPLIAERI